MFRNTGDTGDHFTIGLRWITTAFVLAAGTYILLIAAGVFDPKPIGDERWNLPLAPMSIASGSTQISWLANTGPERPFSLRLAAAYQEGEIDSGYGLVIGDSERFLAVEVSSLGYVSAWQASIPTVQQEAESVLFYLPWQPWPHVHTGSVENEIWLDVNSVGQGEMELTVRINRERLWDGTVNWLSPSIGIIGESFGDDAVITFRSIRLFSEGRSAIP